ncbi:hypothetical protein EVAR_91996_1 [Eumeta japonica]|uniref:Uncharacterized protein n=1 Tax=Eumeta variegata TaxID=151549 RepID=A0A4C1SEE6_EUMVA|nr:hypothetical protein EVAR_91996_1 [Eumeta japonica]
MQYGEHQLPLRGDILSLENLSDASLHATLNKQNVSFSILVQRSSADAVKGGAREPGVSGDRLFKYVS